MKTITKALLCGALVLGQTGTLSPRAALADKVLQGAVCEEHVHKLTSEIDWYKNLKKAEETAADQGKMIFWVHMVGKIDGAT